jgi:hypothetical protein
MAAGLDVAAGALGIAGVAGQLASSILKIKNFCKSVKNAPEELLDTIASVENFSKILIRLGEGQTRALDDMKNGDILRECLGMCKRSADRIATLAMELQLEMQYHSKRGAVKVALKQTTVNAMLQKLDCSKIDLQVAYIMFTDACRRQEYDVIKQYMSEERKERMHLFRLTSSVVQYRDSADDDGLCLTRGKGNTRSRGATYKIDESMHNTNPPPSVVMPICVGCCTRSCFGTVDVLFQDFQDHRLEPSCVQNGHERRCAWYCRAT